MCHALSERGHDVLIATTDADGAERLPVELGRRTIYQNVPALFCRRQWSEAYKYSHPLARWLEAHVRDFDVVHIHAVFSHACLAAARACRRRGVPYVVRPLGTLDPWSLKQKRFRKLAFWYLGGRPMLTGAAAIHYTTQSEEELVAESFGLKRGAVIPLGVEEQLLTLIDEAEDSVAEVESFDGHPYALVLSRLHQKKGLELLLPAFLSLVRRPEFAEWRLVLAGDGDARCGS
jgi:glycosyltransferase involved in cell wall biosynthesis